MRNAVNLNLYEGFRFAGSEVEVSHLQYADDTLCIGTPSVENLWTLKSLLQGFELALGLKINFVKSCLIGVNVQTDFWKWCLVSFIVRKAPSLLDIWAFRWVLIIGEVRLGNLW